MTPFKKNIKNGSHLFRENDRSRELYIIQSGKMKVYRTVGSREIELAVLEKGSVLGEMALIDGKPRSASAKAVEDSVVVIIDAETFHDRIKGVPPWFLSIIKMTSQKIRQANRRLQNFSTGHQSAHVIIALSFYARRFDQGCRGIDIRTMQHHLIQLLGVTSPVIIRVLDFLQKNDIVDISDCMVRILDPHRFTGYCEYLRILIRNQYNGTETPLPSVSLLATALGEQYPAIITGPAESTEIDGEQFYHILHTNNLHQGYTDLLEQLNSDGLCCMLRKTRDISPHPLGDVSVKIQHAGWKRIYLYERFHELNPDGLP